MKKLDEKWFLYALGVGATSVTPSSQAAVVYNDPADITGQTVYFDLDNGIAPNTIAFSEADFQLASTKPVKGNKSEQIFGQSTSTRVAFQNRTGANRSATDYALQFGNEATIGSTLSFVQNAQLQYSGTQPSGETSVPVGNAGDWLPGETGFLGLAIDIAGQTHYGWTQITVNDGTPGPNTFTLHDYAYESDAGTPIVTPVPEPSTAVLLAAGAAGVAALRRRRTAK